MKARTLSVLAPAKINLYLHVTGIREDGYHLLDSFVAFADCGDRIEIEPASGFSFRIKGPFAPAFTAAERDETPESANIAVRAAWLYAQTAGKDLSCRLTLIKNMPLAAESAAAPAMRRRFCGDWLFSGDCRARIRKFRRWRARSGPMCRHALPPPLSI